MTNANWRYAALATLTVAVMAVAGCRSDDVDDDGGDMVVRPTSTTQPAADGGTAAEATKRDIPVNQLPPAVLASFQRQFPGAQIEKVEQETYANGTVHYAVEYKDTAGKEQEVEFTPDGEQLEEHDD